MRASSGQSGDLAREIGVRFGASDSAGGPPVGQPDLPVRAVR
jgi:hypothetical protein